MILFREVNYPEHKEVYLTLGSRAFNSEQTRHSLNDKSLQIILINILEKYKVLELITNKQLKVMRFFNSCFCHDFSLTGILCYAYRMTLNFSCRSRKYLKRKSSQYPDSSFLCYETNAVNFTFRFST